MTSEKFSVSRAAQHEYRVLGGKRPSGADAVARKALEKAHASRAPEAIHITRRERGWAVKTAGREHASVVKPTKAEAVDMARVAAAKRGARLIEHGKDGRIVRNTKPNPAKP
jgi:hypothetical protein